MDIFRICGSKRLCLFINRGVGNGGKPKIILSIGTDFYMCQFEKGIVKGIFKYRKIKPLLIYNSLGKVDAYHSAIAQTYYPIFQGIS